MIGADVSAAAVIRFETKITIGKGAFAQNAKPLDTLGRPLALSPLPAMRAADQVWRLRW